MNIDRDVCPNTNFHTQTLTLDESKRRAQENFQKEKQFYHNHPNMSQKDHKAKKKKRKKSSYIKYQSCPSSDLPQLKTFFKP